MKQGDLTRFLNFAATFWHTTQRMLLSPLLHRQRWRHGTGPHPWAFYSLTAGTALMQHLLTTGIGHSTWSKVGY